MKETLWVNDDNLVYPFFIIKYEYYVNFELNENLLRLSYILSTSPTNEIGWARFMLYQNNDAIKESQNAFFKCALIARRLIIPIYEFAYKYTKTKCFSRGGSTFLILWLSIRLWSHVNTKVEANAKLSRFPSYHETKSSHHNIVFPSSLIQCDLKLIKNDKTHHFECLSFTHPRNFSHKLDLFNGVRIFSINEVTSIITLWKITV